MPNTTAKRSSRWYSEPSKNIPRRVRPGPAVDIPASNDLIDEVVNAVADAWNNQVDEQAPYMFFNTPLSGQRQEIIANSLYRFGDEEQRKFIAKQLCILAQAILGGCFRWTSQH